jgi:hypothetical protein
LFLCTIKEGAEEFLNAVRLPSPQDANAAEPDLATLIKTVAHRLERNANFLRLLLILMLEDQNLPHEFRFKIDEIRTGSIVWWENFLGRIFAPLGATTAAIFAADFATFCRATINGAFIAQQYGEPVEIESVMRQLTLLLQALVDKIVREKI